MNLIAVVILLALSLSATPRDRPDQQTQPKNQQGESERITAPTPQALGISSINKRPAKEETKKTRSKASYICRATAPEYLSQWVLVSIGGIGSGLSGGLSFFDGLGVSWFGLFFDLSFLLSSIILLINTTIPRNNTIITIQRTVFLKNFDMFFI